MPKRAIISVTDKTGLEKFKRLTDAGWEIISTGGTYKELQRLGIPCIPIEAVTGFPEMMGGRIKTLHPLVFGGILAERRNPDHIAAVLKHCISLCDLVVVNLYPFLKSPSIENIDIGGPSLIRAAAKNSFSIMVLVDPADYNGALDCLTGTEKVPLSVRARYAVKVFGQTSGYDAAIYEWMKAHLGSETEIEEMYALAEHH